MPRITCVAAHDGDAAPAADVHAATAVVVAVGGHGAEEGLARSGAMLLFLI